MSEEQEQELRKLYERYKLQWMLYHDLGLTDLIEELEAMIREDEQSGENRRTLQELFEAWEFGVGFIRRGVWPCYEEFMQKEHGHMEPKTLDKGGNTMLKNPVEICKSGITIVTEDADGEVYTIVANSIPDVINDWKGDCDCVPSNEAPVHFAVFQGELIDLPQDCNFETMMSILVATQDNR